MRISDWSSDVCSSDLYSYIILILTVYEKHLWSKSRAGQRHQTRAGIVVAGVGTARWRGRTMALSKRAYEGRAARRAVTRTSACRSEEHTSELQSLMRISYAVFCLKKQKPELPT